MGIRNLTGRFRLGRGPFGIAICQVEIETEEARYWSRATASEWHWVDGDLPMPKVGNK